jgi:hypothetical protein
MTGVRDVRANSYLMRQEKCLCIVVCLLFIVVCLLCFFKHERCCSLCREVEIPVGAQAIHAKLVVVLSYKRGPICSAVSLTMR